MKTKMIVLAATSALLVSAANAATLNFLGADADKSRSLTVNFNGNNISAIVGVMNINIDGGPTLEAVCVDLAHVVTSGMSYEVTGLGIGDLGLNSNLVANVFANGIGNINSKDAGAAFQLAIWDALYDGGDGLDSGSFQATHSSVTNNIKNLYSTFAGAKENAPDQPWDYTYWQATSHPNGKHQDMLTGEAVPEPATLAILGLGALAAARKRRKA